VRAGRLRGRDVAVTAPEPTVTGKLSRVRLDELLSRLADEGYQREAEELGGHIKALEREREQASLEIDGQPVTGWRGRIVIERQQARGRAPD
jgi:hypothetical protein